MGFEIQEIALHETAQERYLNYAMSVITSRALPDVRDGLKPVQRRIIYAMAHELRLTHDARHRKSAAVVGSVMAKYHPHGDSSIYDAMVRMAQDFSLRYPLVDGQGNFGSLDGDSAAAMRYTEAKLTPLSSELITELRQRTVPMRPNYDGTVFEPVVLPAQVPNLLINGATGIAVGMATNIPPHNLAEIIDGLIAMIKDPQISVHHLMAHIHAPDFPTGGVILETPHELEAMYTTGSGTVTIRAEWELEQEEGGKRQVIIRSIPYTVNKSTLVEKIAQHIAENKLPQIVDVRDESTEQVRIVLELKRKAPHEPAMAYLFKHTPLQHRFHVNLTCLVPTENPEVGAPARLNLAEMLRHFLDFRMEVVTKRLEHELAQLLRRIHLLEGLAIIFNALDEALALIRSSDGKADAASKLIARFELDDEQADAVLEKKLYALAKLEIKSILEELARRREEAAAIEALLADPSRRWGLIQRELSALRSAYNDPRRSRVGAEIKQFEYSEENYIVEEEVHVIVSREGWIKRQKSYSDISAIRVREHDEVRWVLPGTTRGTVLFFSSKGRVYTMRIDDLPSTSGHGDPLQTKFDFDDGERIVGVLTSHATIFSRYEALPEEDAQLALIQSAAAPEPADKTSPGDPGARLQIFAVGERGLAVRATLEGFMDPSTVRGRQFMKLDEDEQVVNVEPCRGDEIVSIASRDGRALTFMCRDVSLFKGAAKGVKAMALEKKDTILDFTLVRGKQEGLEVETNRGTRYVIKASRYPTIARGNKGSCVIQRGHLIRAYRPPVALRPDEAEGVVDEADEVPLPTAKSKPQAPLVQAPLNSDEEIL